MTFKEFCKELLEEYGYIIVDQSNRNAIVIGPAWSYYIEGITEKFSVDCCNHHMAGINNIARIKKYGDIKEIKRA